MIGFHKRAVIGITALGALGGVNASDANPIPSLSDNLRYAITPYLWAPGISGNIDYNNGQSAHTNISTDKVLNNLSIGAMGDAEVHYGRWGLLGNAIFALQQQILFLIDDLFSQVDLIFDVENQVHFSFYRAQKHYHHIPDCRNNDGDLPFHLYAYALHEIQLNMDRLFFLEIQDLIFQICEVHQSFHLLVHIQQSLQ